MAKIIQHLRGTTAEWNASDITPADGEIAVEHTVAGLVRLKVGDGTSAYSELPYVDSRILESSGTVALLHYGLDVRFETVSELSIVFPDTVPDDYFSTLTFTSDADAISVSYPAGTVTFSGDHVENGVFLPETNTHYTLGFWYDGSMQCTVRGVNLATS